MEVGEMKRNTSNWSNFCMLLRHAGLTTSAGLSCFINFSSFKLDMENNPNFDAVSNKHVNWRDAICLDIYLRSYYLAHIICRH